MPRVVITVVVVVIVIAVAFVVVFVAEIAILYDILIAECSQCESAKSCQQQFSIGGLTFIWLRVEKVTTTPTATITTPVRVISKKPNCNNQNHLSYKK